MKRRILVTTVINIDTGVQYDIYGRYDAVALASRHQNVVRSRFCMFEMSDTDFVKYGRFVGEVEPKKEGEKK